MTSTGKRRKNLASRHKCHHEGTISQATDDPMELVISSQAEITEPYIQYAKDKGLGHPLSTAQADAGLWKN